MNAGKALRSVSFMGASIFSRVLVNFVTTRMAFRFLGAEAFSVFVVLQSVAMFVAMSEMGLGQSMLNFQGEAYARKDWPRASAQLGSALGLYLIIAVIGFLVSVGLERLTPIAAWLLKAGSEAQLATFSAYFLWQVAAVFLLFPSFAFGATLGGFQDLDVRNAVDLAIPVASLGLIYGTLRSGLGIGGVILAQAIISVLTLGAYGIALRRRHGALFPTLNPLRILREASAPRMRLLLANSSYFLLIGIAIVIGRSSTNLVTSSLIGTAEVAAVFAVIMLTRNLGVSLIDVFSRAIQPAIILSHTLGESERVARMYRASAMFSAIFAALYAGLVWLGGEWLIHLWLGEALHIPSGLIELATLLFLVETWFATFFNTTVALNQQRALSLVFFLQAVLTLGVGIGVAWLAPPEHKVVAMIGAQVLTSAGYQFLVIPRIAMRVLGLSLRQFTDIFIMKPGWLLLAGVPFLAITSAWLGRDASLKLVALVAYVAWVALIGWARVLGPEERAAVLGLVRRGRLAGA